MLSLYSCSIIVQNGRYGLAYCIINSGVANEKPLRLFFLSVLCYPPRLAHTYSLTIEIRSLLMPEVRSLSIWIGTTTGEFLIMSSTVRRSISAEWIETRMVTSIKRKRQPVRLRGVKTAGNQEELNPATRCCWMFMGPASSAATPRA